MGLIESLSIENRKRLEAIATRKRSELDFKAYEPLPATVLAKHFQAEIYTPETFIIQKKMTLTQIALYFNASEEMVRFRSNVNGISVNY